MTRRPVPRSVTILAAVFLVFVVNIWAYDLWAPDEPFFGDGARAMLHEGEWLVPHVNGKPNEHKPPLFFWLIAGTGALTGGTITSFAARFPSVLAATLAVALTMRIGRRMGGPVAGNWAAVILATSYLVWDKARSAQIEATLLACIVGALCAFDLFRAGEMCGRTAGIIFWSAAALGTLAKGPVGLLLPLGIALATLASDRDLRAWRRFAPFAGPFFFAVIVGLWVVPVELSGGPYSVFSALRTHFFSRALHGMHHQNPPWYYFGTIPLHMLPWSALLPLALYAGWRRRAEPAARFLLAWAGFVVLFFTLSGERRDLYVLPAFPALALLIALYARPGAAASRAVAPGLAPAAEPGRRAVTVPLGALGFVLALLGLALPLARSRIDPVPHAAAIALGGLLAAGGLTIAVLAWRGRGTAAMTATAATFAGVYLAAALAVLPALDPVKSARSFAQGMAEATAPHRAEGGEVVAYRMGNVPNALSYFTGIATVEEDDPQRLAAHLAAAPAWAVVDERVLAELPADLRARLDVVATAKLSRIPAALVQARGAALAGTREALAGSTRKDPRADSQSENGRAGAKPGPPVPN